MLGRSGIQEPTAKKGIPALLGAFPVHAYLDMPMPGKVIGREEFARGGRADGKISTQHVRFHFERGTFIIEDVGSRNGTYVDGKKIRANERARIEDGSVLRIGMSLFVFRTEYRGLPAAYEPLGALIGPWGLVPVREQLTHLQRDRPIRVLIEAPPGAGEDLLAVEVARALGRDPTRLAAVQLSGAAEQTLDAHLFGWEAGAIPGAPQPGMGLFRAFDGGAILLNDLGGLPPGLLHKLMRVLDHGEVWPIGAQHPARVDVTVLAAVGRSSFLIERQPFGRDLLARFLGRVVLPPLEDRVEDLFAVWADLWQRRHGPLDLSRTPVDVEAVERLMLHDWPENLRELDWLAVHPAAGTGLTLKSVVAFLGSRTPSSGPPPGGAAALDRTMYESGGDRREAAKRLGITRGRLLKWLESLGRGK